MRCAPTIPLLLAACAGSSAADENMQITWTGPEVRVAASDPLTVEVTVPTGGFELRRDAAGDLEIRLTLVGPGDDELVTQAFETLRLPLPDAPKVRPLPIRIAREQRGVHYFVPPPHELAAVVTR